MSLLRRHFWNVPREKLLIKATSIVGFISLCNRDNVKKSKQTKKKQHCLYVPNVVWTGFSFVELHIDVVGSTVAW